MLRIIWLQFTHSFKTWLLTLLLFVVTGFLIGTCFNAICTIADHFPNLPKAINPTDGFYYPLIFGILTILIISSGIIKLVINQSNQEYILWIILGASPRQLSLLISGQLALIGGLGSFIGFIMAVPVMVHVDSWFVTVFAGSTLARRFPTLPMEFSVRACILTVGFSFIVCAIAGLLHSYRLFVNKSKSILSKKQPQSRFQLVTRSLLVIVSIVTLVALYWNSLTLTPQAQYYLHSNQFHEAGKTYVQNLMLILLISIILFSLISRIILPWLIKVWTWILPRKVSPSINTAYWNTLSDRDYLSSLMSPLIAGSIMLTGVTYIAGQITNGGGNAAAETNLQESLILFVGAPLIIILANVLTITILTSNKKEVDLNQLSLLGFTPQNLVNERFQESFIYSITLLICGVISNLPLFLLITHIAAVTHNPITLSWTSIFSWPILLFLIILVFVTTTWTLQVPKVIKTSAHA